MMATILVVQKNTQVLQGIQESLEQNEHEVLAVSSIKLGVKALENNPCIALVICDLATADRSGLDLLQHIQTTPRLHWIPVLMTGRTFDGDTVRVCLELGATDIVVLPTDGESLMSKVDKALSDGRRTVLIVDDDEPVLNVLSDTFEIERFDVLKAGSAEEALELLDKSRVHVVVSDILLPRKSGFELLKEIKAQQESLPVILVTGYSGKYRPQDVLDAGADGYFTKPFKNVELILSIRRVLKATSSWHSRRQRMALQR